MAKIAVFLAEGFEEIEGLTVVDICRRCRIDVETVSITDDRTVISSHKSPVLADITLDQADFNSYDMLVLPGGLMGTKNLEACDVLTGQLDAFYEAGKNISAICAAPSIFGHRGYLKGRKATSYPDFESHLEGAMVNHANVEVDGHVITSRGMGTSIDFALAIASRFVGADKAEEVAKQVMYH